MPTDFSARPIVRTVPGKGRGVFATRGYKRGATVLCDPVALIEVDALRDGSRFNDYPMRWSETHNAIAFGLTNLFNHSDDPNCDVILDYDGMTIVVVALRTIRFGEELTIRYACPVWW